jgi:hypothetical protein
MGYAVTLPMLDLLDTVEVAAERMRASTLRGLNPASMLRRRNFMERLSDDVCGAAAELGVRRLSGLRVSRPRSQVLVNGLACFGFHLLFGLALGADHCYQPLLTEHRSGLLAGPAGFDGARLCQVVLALSAIETVEALGKSAR